MTRLRMALVLFAALLGLSALAGCGDDDSGSGVAPEAQSPIAKEAESEDRCQAVEEPEPKRGNLDRPASLEPTPGNIVFETSCGVFTVELDTEAAPQTTASVEYLVREGFYDGLTFHRIVTNFLIQGGDPKGNGSGGPGYFLDEPPPEDVTYPKWSVVMAKASSDPAGRSGSQFFVVLADDADLDPDQALIGEVVSGFEAVERIAAIGPPSGEGEPATTVTIEDARFEPSE